MRRLLFAHLKYSQLALSVLGAVVGIFMLLISFQYYLDFTSYFRDEETDLIQPEYLVINKKVSLLNAFYIASGFTSDELNELAALPNVRKVGSFTSNLFEASAGISDKMVVSIAGNIYADLFFESVDDEFIDIKTKEWQWNDGGRVVPVIIPMDYLRLYNFGFAPSRQLPQLSSAATKSFHFDIRIDSFGHSVLYKGKLVGFSNRINSILVPEKFLETANRYYGTKSRKEPSRVILLTNDPTDRNLLDYLDKKGYETNAEQLKNARLTSFLKLSATAILSVGALIVFLALLGFVQYIQLLMYRSAYEIRCLFELGYGRNYFYKFYGVFILTAAFSIMLTSLAAVIAVKYMLTDYISGFGFTLGGGISMHTFILAVGVMLVFCLTQWISLKRGIEKITK